MWGARRLQESIRLDLEPLDVFAGFGLEGLSISKGGCTEVSGKSFLGGGPRTIYSGFMVKFGAGRVIFPPMSS